jgi:hypothetical protein
MLGSNFGESFREYLKHMLGGQSNDSYEPIAPLSKDEQVEWESFNEAALKLRAMTLDLEARKRLFWSSMEHKTGIYDRNLKIDNGMILVEKKETNKCPSKNKNNSIPGFCDGNCSDCSMEHGEQDV